MLANPNSTYSDFNTGNVDTLWNIPLKKGINISAELRKFYDKYYSSSIMKLVVIGNITVDELESLVIDKFSDIPLKNIVPPKCDYPYDGVQLPVEVRYDPAFKDHIMTLVFPIKVDLKTTADSQPFKYLSMLVSYRGEQGLNQKLKKLGYILDLDIGYSSMVINLRNLIYLFFNKIIYLNSF